MAHSPHHRLIGPVLGTLAIVAAVALPSAATAREPARVQVQRARATLAVADRQTDGLGRTLQGSLRSITVVRSRGVRVMRGTAEETTENRTGPIDDGPAPWAPADTMIRARDYPAFYLTVPDQWAGYRGGLASRYAALAARTDYALARLHKLRRPMLQGAAYPAVPQAWTVHQGPAYGTWPARSLPLSAR